MSSIHLCVSYQLLVSNRGHRGADIYLSSLSVRGRNTPWRGHQRTNTLLIEEARAGIKAGFDVPERVTLLVL